MRYLTSGLVAEGLTDDRFLRPLLSRALEELCSDEFDESVEVSEVPAFQQWWGETSSALAEVGFKRRRR